MNRILSIILNSPLIIIFVITLAVSTRLVAHPYNFTPVLAFSLMMGVYSKNNLGILVPISIMFISDYFLGFHDTILSVYLSISLVYLLGYYLINNYKFKNILLGSMVGPLLFFIITNFGVWMNDGIIGIYADNFMGLMDCYYRALPFFRSTLLSTVFYSGIIHVCYLLLYEKFPVFQSNK